MFVFGVVSRFASGKLHRWSAVLGTLLIGWILIGPEPAHSAPKPPAAAPPASTGGYRTPTLPTPPELSQSGTEASDEKRVLFKSQSILVQVPVLVTIKPGVHAAGLKKENFHVFEDGEERPLAAFEEVKPSSARILAPPSRPKEAQNLVIDPAQPRAVTILVLDTVNTPFLDQAYGRQQIIKYLADHVEPNQALALVMITSKGLKVVHGITADPAVLIQALKNVKGQINALQGISPDAQAASAQAASSFDSPATTLSTSAAFPSSSATDLLEKFTLTGDAAIAGFQQEQAVETTLQSFAYIASAMAGIPGRKAMIWATGSFPFNFTSPGSVPPRFAVLYEKTMRALNDAQIAIYPVDVRGLVNSSPAADVTLRSAGRGGDFANLTASRSSLLASTTDTLRDVAEMTGGRAFFNTNDISGAINRAAEDSSSYYLLGYYLDVKNDQPGWRKLKVKVDLPHSEVRARSGFFVTNATFGSPQPSAEDVTAAMLSPWDATGLPLTLRWDQAPGTGPTRKLGFVVTVAGSAITLDADKKNRFSLDIAASADQNGKHIQSFSKTFQGALKDDFVAQVKAKGMGYPSSFQLPPGAYSLRVVVRDNLSGSIGSVTTALDVK